MSPLRLYFAFALFVATVGLLAQPALAAWSDYIHCWGSAPLHGSGQ